MVNPVYTQIVQNARAIANGQPCGDGFIAGGLQCHVGAGAGNKGEIGKIPKFGRKHYAKVGGRLQRVADAEKPNPLSAEWPPRRKPPGRPDTAIAQPAQAARPAIERPAQPAQAARPEVQRPAPDPASNPPLQPNPSSLPGAKTEEPQSDKPKPTQKRAKAVKVETLNVSAPEPELPKPSEAKAVDGKAVDGKAEDKSDVRSSKLSSEIVNGKNLKSVAIKNGGVNTSYKVTYEVESGGSKKTEAVVFKPTAGERKGLRGNINDKSVPASRREMAAFDVATKLGIDVPDVSRVEVGGQDGTAMRWIDGIKDGGDKFAAGGVKKQPARLTELAVFDFIIGNTDRHSGNLIVDNKGNLYPIDNGLTFPESRWRADKPEVSIGGNMSQFISKASRSDSVGGEPRMRELMTEVAKPEFKAYLRNSAVKRGLKPESADLAVKRAEFLVETFKLADSKNPAQSVAKTFYEAKTQGWY